MNKLQKYFGTEKLENLNWRLLMLYLLLLLPLLSSCQYLPEVAKDIEEIATDTAIKVEISKETFLKDTNLEITINVQNKDQPVK